MARSDVLKRQIMSPFGGAGALGQAGVDWQTAAFDHSEHGFLGGAYLVTWQTGGRPINQTRTPEAAGKWLALIPISEPTRPH